MEDEIQGAMVFSDYGCASLDLLTFIKIIKLPLFGQELHNLNLSINNGEFVTIFGPNGCGKSTLLKVIAGIESYNDGNVLIDSNTPALSNTGLIFQNYSDSLFPWLTCKENLVLLPKEWVTRG